MRRFIDLGRAANPGKTWDRIAMEAVSAVIAAIVLMYCAGLVLP